MTPAKIPERIIIAYDDECVCCCQVCKATHDTTVEVAVPTIGRIDEFCRFGGRRDELYFST